MTQKSTYNHQRCYESNMQLWQQAQSIQRSLQQSQASSQRLQDQFQACQKHLQESYQRRNLNNPHIEVTDRIFGCGGPRFWLWFFIQGMATAIIVPVTFHTLSVRVATKVLPSLLGCSAVITAIGCYYYNRPI